ncbi:hypothetical protein B0H15DRAFT_797931 [Mycena belliarum]|uniref:Uncharacterized protein n=1 Tax=Mycena belliarum TaxID=1033014 RepID=A0AAD6UCJ3_9AGAR|nr:hypothetical protein B0H15DRAFT_797931 [Mycena belliae]
MTDTTLASNASTPQEEMDALVAKVAALTLMSLDMARLCVDVQNVVPGIALSKQALEMTSLCIDVKTQIAPAFTAAANRAIASLVNAPVPAPVPVSDHLWVKGIALTPDQLEASFGPGVGDEQTWHVVCIGREPGLYASPTEANLQIEGVPNQFREKKKSRVEALAFYRHRYESARVEKWNAVPVDDNKEDVDSALPSAGAASSNTVPKYTPVHSQNGQAKCFYTPPSLLPQHCPINWNSPVTNRLLLRIRKGALRHWITRSKRQGIYMVRAALRQRCKGIACYCLHWGQQRRCARRSVYFRWLLDAWIAWHYGLGSMRFAEPGGAVARPRIVGDIGGGFHWIPSASPRLHCCPRHTSIPITLLSLPPTDALPPATDSSL